MSALIVFGKATSASEAAAGNVTVAAASLKVGAAAGIAGTVLSGTGAAVVTLRAMAKMGTGLRLGYIGVLGVAPRLPECFDFVKEAKTFLWIIKLIVQSVGYDASIVQLESHNLQNPISELLKGLSKFNSFQITNS